MSIPVYDAIIVGGGPAGASCARLLASWGHSVLVLTREPDASRGLGETLPPSTRKLLHTLGVLERIERHGFAPNRAALDPVTEQDLISGLRTVMRDRTIIVITHRLEVARRADRVLVLDQAKVIEEGVPDTLAEQQGAFAALFGSHAVA